MIELWLIDVHFVQNEPVTGHLKLSVLKKRQIN